MKENLAANDANEAGARGVRRLVLRVIPVIGVIACRDFLLSLHPCPVLNTLRRDRETEMKTLHSAVGVMTIFAALSPSLLAQWPPFPTPGVPKTPTGEPNLSAPAPRTADGKPDLS